MFILKAAYCRMVQTAFRLALPVLPYREPHVVDGLQGLAQVLARENIARPLVVTDPGVARLGLLDRLTQQLEAAGAHCTVYAQTQPNPTVDNVEQALEMYRDQRCDSLIAMGGGSAMDCAKAVGARVVHPKRSLRQMRGVLRVWRRLPTLIAIPTTAGTGSEVTLAAVITDAHKHDKYALMSFPLIPRYAVLDATLTTSLPPRLTAATGMDALTHAVEAYIGRSTTRHTRQLALQATETIFANILQAYMHNDCLEARRNMLYAAYQAGAAFSQSYVGYIHAIAHAVGGRYGTPHGLANAVIMPHVLQAYGKAVYPKLHRLGVAAEVCSAQDDDAVGARKFICAIRALNDVMNLPETLDDIRREDIPLLARHAEREANPLYPVPVLMEARELEAICHQLVADQSDD